MAWFGLGSYGAAAVVYAAITAVLVAGRPTGLVASRIRWAAALSTLWAAAMTALVIRSGPLLAFVAFDAIHTLAWTVAVLAWLAQQSNSGRWSVRRALMLVSVGLAIWGLIAAVVAPGATGPMPVGQGSAFFALLGMALTGLLAVEQVFRNADSAQREQLRLLCFAIGAIFVVDVFVYAQAALLGGLIEFSWEARGLANALLAPLVVIALRHPTETVREIALSRKVAFYTTSLVGVGAYLVLMGLAAYLIREFGGEWGLLLQISFVLAAVLALGVLIFSSGTRAQIRVLLVKHFYKNKYDYRGEWLRLTESLARSGELGTIARNGLEGIAGIVGSTRASLWVTTDGAKYEQVAEIGAPGVGASAYQSSNPLIQFIGTTGWVVDSEEYAGAPDRYGRSFGEPEASCLPAQSLIVPLDSRGFLQGFVVLGKPAEVRELNFEDHDILKTAGKQVAVVLAQALAQEQLSATRQFEAFNKLSTFLMHDLKNLIAQQDLVVANAKKFRHRPEFIDDVVRSIESGAQRMRSILERLRNASATEHTARVDVDKLLREACNQCADRAPEPTVTASHAQTFVEVDRERLFMAIVHAVRNAQDASRSDGRIDLRLTLADTSAIIEVADVGAGMSEEFIRDRLFRPFDSTKGAQGMGVGAYQIRETLKAAGGSVEVDSVPGKGTTIRMILPRAVGGAAARSVA